MEQENGVRSPLPKEEGAVETMCEELTTKTSFPHPLHHCGGGCRETVNKVKPGKEAEICRRCFYDLAFDWQQIKLISLSRVCLAHDGN